MAHEPNAAAFPDTEPLTQPMAGSETWDAPTEPMPLRADPPVLSLAPKELTLYEVLAAMRKDNRVCPQPTRWLEFYRLLETRVPGAALPAAPLTGSAWAATPPLAKRMCFREQVEWADAHGLLQEAYEFLDALPESDWHFMA